MVLSQLNEEEFYNKLSNYLKLGKFKEFADLINQSPELDIHVNPKLIPYRFEYISELILNNLKKVVTSYQISILGEIIKILRFVNQFNLFEKDLSHNEEETINNLIKDSIFISNLNDLFGKPTNSFILYLRFQLPQIILSALTNFWDKYFGSTEQFIKYVNADFWNLYNIYGLNVKKISTFKAFFEDFNKKYPYPKRDFIELEIFYRYKYFEIDNEIKEGIAFTKHLVSPKNLFNIADEIKNKNNYKFYSLSMVLLGGIGPQGHGFTYVTPKREVIEICSDIKENDAIIIRYKVFLKNQFLFKLRNELSSLEEDLRDNIINYLDTTLNQKEMIGYNKYQKVLRIISNYLNKFNEILEKNKIDFDTFLKFISETVSIILRPIDMVDQFKCRMSLINEGKLSSDDIAKLTSLRGKSHYDVLIERLFFQYINDWFYELYLDNKAKQNC